MTYVEKTHVDQASVWEVLQDTRCLDLSGAFMICQEHCGQTLVMRALVRSHLGLTVNWYLARKIVVSLVNW